MLANPCVGGSEASCGRWGVVDWWYEFVFLKDIYKPMVYVANTVVVDTAWNGS
jgi:hypothetical protein